MFVFYFFRFNPFNCCDIPGSTGDPFRGGDLNKFSRGIRGNLIANFPSNVVLLCNTMITEEKSAVLVVWV